MSIALILIITGSTALAEVTMMIGSGWNMISFWFATDTMIQNLADSGVDFYSYSPTTNNYSKVLSSSEINIGRSYWAWTMYGAKVVFDTDPLNMGSAYETTLESGWNLIGNPFPRAISMGDIYIGDIPFPEVMSSQGGQPSYSYENERYTETDGQLLQGDGAWVYVKNSTGIKYNLPSGVVADAGKNHKCIIGVYHRPTWNGTVNEYTEYDITCKLDGSGSYRTGGNSLSYQWTQLTGPDVNLTTPTASTTEFVPAIEGIYEFMLTASNDIEVSTDTVKVEADIIQGKIVFSSNLEQNHTGGNIYTMNADGTGLKKLTEDDNVERSHVSWSPDGSRIIFFSSEDGDSEIYSMNENGTDIVKITDNDNLDVKPTWSIDNRISFASDRDGSFNIYDMDLNGSDVRKLSNLNGSSCPIYSFDGEYIAFINDYGGDKWEVVVMDKDGNGIKQLTKEGFIHVWVAWTTNDKMLFVEKEDWGLDERLYVINIDGTGKRELPIRDDSTDFTSLDMTDDGCFIFYSDSNDQLIHAMCTDGSCNVGIGYGVGTLDYHPGP